MDLVEVRYGQQQLFEDLISLWLSDVTWLLLLKMRKIVDADILWVVELTENQKNNIFFTL